MSWVCECCEVQNWGDRKSCRHCGLKREGPVRNRRSPQRGEAERIRALEREAVELKRRLSTRDWPTLRDAAGAPKQDRSQQKKRRRTLAPGRSSSAAPSHGGSAIGSALVGGRSTGKPGGLADVAGAQPGSAAASRAFHAPSECATGGDGGELADLSLKALRKRLAKLKGLRDKLLESKAPGSYLELLEAEEHFLKQAIEARRAPG